MKPFITSQKHSNILKTLPHHTKHNSESNIPKTIPNPTYQTLNILNPKYIKTSLNLN